MAINSYFDNTDINIYFHMKNHYKKLRSARSTIDNSFPQSFLKIYTPPNSERSLKSDNLEEERCNSNGQHLTSRSAITRKLKCNSSASGTSETSVKTIPPRPKTRRNCLRPSSNTQYYPRSQSASSSYKRDTIGTSKTKKKRNASGTKDVFEDVKFESNSKIDLMDEDKCSKYDEQNTNCNISSKDTHDKVGGSSRIEEHEYLQFVLRITEDIIINNLYKNEDIERVFQTHIEANKDHLKVEKMEAQLAILCAELQIPYKNNSSEKCYERFFDHDIYSSDYIENLQDCECTTKRTLMTEDRIHDFESGGKKREMGSEFKRMFNIVANKCSLSRVTECTETSNSLDTLIEQIKQFSITNILDSEYNLEHLENLKTDSTNSEELLEIQKGGFPDIQEKLLICEPDLTEKEKLSDMEEGILYDKYSSNNRADEIDSEIDDTEMDKSKNFNFFKQGNINSRGNNIESATAVLCTTNIPDPFAVNMIEEVKEKSETDMEISENKAREDTSTHLNISNADIKKSIESLSVDENRDERNYEGKSKTDLNISYSDMTFKRGTESYLETKLDVPFTVSNNDIKNLFENLDVSCQKNFNKNKQNEVPGSGSQFENLKAADFRNEGKMKENENSSFHIENFEGRQPSDSKLPYILMANENQDHIMKDIILQNFVQNNMQPRPDLFAEEKVCPSTNDQCTQVEIKRCDKECNTSIILNEYMTNDYVLLNGPIYVLKSILNSEDKLIIYDKDNARNLHTKDSATRLSNDKLIPLQCCESIPVLESQAQPVRFEDDFSKLLNSDYDLMPQRDSNSSNNNYHHLLVDASTNISNTNLDQAINNMFINPDSLLLSNKYELFNVIQENVIPKTDKLHVKGDFQKNSTDFETGLGTNQRELETCLLSKEENGCTQNSSCSVDDKTGEVFREDMSSHELNASLTNYNMLSKNTIKQTNISRDVSESGEIIRPSICTDDEISYDLMSRSEKERNSSTSPPNRSNLLGKRKLEHPS